jgi:RimJ/RimL family protein N-acetyltransferase
MSAEDPRTHDSVTLRGGDTVTIRAIRPDDAPRLQALFALLSPDSVFFRFLTPAKQLTNEQATSFANVDYQMRMGLVATSAPRGEENIVAVARYAEVQPSEPGVVEFAIVVQDRYQGRGLGTILLKRLVAYAQTHAILTFLARVHPENTRMLGLLQHSGFPIKLIETSYGELTFELKLHET